MPAKEKEKMSNVVLLTCADCKKGTWKTNSINLDIHGRPFMKVCEHATWHIVNGEKLTLQDSRACEHIEILLR